MKNLKKPTVSELINHLTEKQIEKLYAEYIQGGKNIDLIEKYNIDINPNKLFALFPLIEHKDSLCPYCNISMFSKRKSKSSGKIFYPNINCYSCSHVNYSNLPINDYKFCRCDGCIKVKKEYAIKRKMLLQERVFNKFSLNNFQPIPLDKLSLKQLLFLVALLRSRRSSESGLIEPDDDLKRLNPLTPSVQMDLEILDELYRAHVILVCPESNFDVLSEVNDESLDSLNYNEIHWFINISNESGQRLDISECFHLLHEVLSDIRAFEESDGIYELLYEIAINEVLHFIELSSNSLGLPTSAKQKKYDVIKLLLKDFPVRKLFYMSQLAVNQAQLFFDKGLSQGKKHAANTIPGKMLNYGSRAKSENWNIYEFKRTTRNPRSALSVVIYELLLNVNDDGFHVVIDELWKNKLETESFNNHSKAEDEVVNICSSCSSNEVIVECSSNSVTIQCESCGAISSYRF